MISKVNENIMISGKVLPDSSYRTVWNGNSIIPMMSGRRASLTVSSESANDSISGSGARTVLIEGLNASLEMIAIEVEMNGQSPVDIGDLFAHVNSAMVLTTGSTGHNEDVIHIGTGTVTSGVPSTSYEQIPVRDGISQTVRYVVPKGKIFHVKRVALSRLTDKSFLVDMKKYYNGSWITMNSFAFETGDRCHVYDSPLVIPSGHAFAMEVSNDAGAGEMIYAKVFGEEK